MDWIRTHPGIAALWLGIFLAAGQAAQVAANVTLGGLLSLLLPVIVAVVFYFMLRTYGNRPPN